MFKVYAYDKKCLPKQHYLTDAGIDLRAVQKVTLHPDEIQLVPCGIHLEIESKYVGLIFPRSGLASKCDVSLANAVGVIDSDYRGEIMCAMVYRGDDIYGYTIKKYDRIAQLVTVPIHSGYTEVENFFELSTTERGSGGFGSTGNG